MRSYFMMISNLTLMNSLYAYCFSKIKIKTKAALNKTRSCFSNFLFSSSFKQTKQVTIKQCKSKMSIAVHLFPVPIHISNLLYCTHLCSKVSGACFLFLQLQGLSIPLSFKTLHGKVSKVRKRITVLNKFIKTSTLLHSSTFYLLQRCVNVYRIKYFNLLI